MERAGGEINDVFTVSKDRPRLKTMFKMSSFKSIIYRLEEKGLLEGYWPIYLSM